MILMSWRWSCDKREARGEALSSQTRQAAPSIQASRGASSSGVMYAIQAFFHESNQTSTEYCQCDVALPYPLVDFVL